MPNNELDNFLSDVKGEVKDPLEQKVEDPFKGEEVKDDEVSDEKKEEDKPIAFHKDPKIMRFIEKEIAKRMDGLKPAEAKEIANADSKEEADEILTRIIGNDTPEKVRAVKDFRQYLTTLEEKGAQKALAQIEGQAEAERQAEADAEEELTQGFENIEETYGIDITSPKAQKLRGEFVDFIRRISPKDENGDVVSYPDLQEAYGIFAESKKSTTPSRAKELASRGMQRSGEASTASKDEDKSWRGVEKIFSKFS